MPRSPLRSDDPIFSNLSVIKNEEYLLRNELVFDPDAIEDKSKLRNNKNNKGKPDYDIQWLENTLKTYSTRLILNQRLSQNGSWKTHSDFY